MSHERRRSGHNLGTILGALGLCVLLLVAGGSKPAGKGAPPPPEVPEPVPCQSVKPGTVEVFAVWVNSAREVNGRIRDYQCTFTKRERIDGVLQDEQTAQMKVRAEPFSVHVKFTAPRAVAGKEGSYVLGRNNGKMRAKSGGALGLVGYVTIAPTDPKAMQGTRHSITEAGLAHLIERLGELRPAAGQPELEILVSEYRVKGRASVRFDVTDPNADGKHHQHRTVVYFDRETNLPLRYEAYDRGGELVEYFAYSDLRCNVGLTDAAFP